MLAALPWSVQKELIERSGRGKQQQSLVRQFGAAAAAAAAAGVVLVAAAVTWTLGRCC